MKQSTQAHSAASSTSTPANPSSSSSLSRLIPVLGVASAITLVGWALYRAWKHNKQTSANATENECTQLEFDRKIKQLTRVRIGTRTSQLALWQANHMADLLKAKYPHITFEVVGMNTLGDIDQIKPLSDFASKGVFTKELDTAVLTHQIDLAVHCMKDLPTTLPAGLEFGCVLARGDVEDCLVLPAVHAAHINSLETLPANSKIGTSAMRRMAILRILHPHLRCDHIRGNVNTRLAKLDRGEYDAIILARVGLERLGLEHRISCILPKEQFGYAVGQGALAVLCRADDEVTQHLLRPFEDVPTRCACEAERGVLRTLQGGCKVPITVRTTFLPTPSPASATSSFSPSTSCRCSSSSSSFQSQRHIRLWCSVMSMDGKQQIEDQMECVLDEQVQDAYKDANLLGCTLGDHLLYAGADKLLNDITDRAGTGLQAPTKRAQH